MLVNCQGLDLSEAFLRVSKAISNKITNPILEGIKIVAEDDTLTLSATDTELSIERKIKANIKTEGEAVVPKKYNPAVGGYGNYSQPIYVTVNADMDVNKFGKAFVRDIKTFSGGTKNSYNYGGGK